MHTQRHLHISGRALWTSGIFIPGAALPNNYFMRDLTASSCGLAI